MTPRAENGSTSPTEHHDATSELARMARRDLELLAHPTEPWLERRSVDGAPVDDVVFVGGGQSGVVGAAALQREGVERVAVLDCADAGSAGPWTTYARMEELRTPKQLVGTDLGLPNLSVRAWHAARYGEAEWCTFDRLPRLDWHRYLDWFTVTTGVMVEHNTTVVGIEPAPDNVLTITTEVGGARRQRHARTVVLSTGMEGAGGWRVPDFVRDTLRPDRYDHSNSPIDFAALAGARVGILGHGASAFDNAIAAMTAGAESVDICFRRQRLPRTNPHRKLETAGLMSHYCTLPDATRWDIARFFRLVDQPPPIRSFRTAMATPGVVLRPATPWISVAEVDDQVCVTTPAGELWFDHLILATGAVVDLESRAELATIVSKISRWSDHHTPADDDADPRLAQLPYLGPGYEFLPKDPADDWVRSVFAFNGASFVSHGPHSTSISGHKHALPRLVRGVTERLFATHGADVLDGLQTFDSLDLPVNDDFEATVIAGARTATSNAPRTKIAP